MQGTVWKRSWRRKGVEHHAWVLDYRQGGKRRRKQFATRQEANLALGKLIQEQREGTYGTVIEGVTFKEFISIYDQKKQWRSETYRERVRIACEKSLVRFHDLPLTRITPDLIEEFKRERLKEVAPSTVRQELAALSDLCRYAVRLHYLADNPVRHVERPALETKQDNPATYLPAEELDQLLAVAGRDRRLYEVAVATGLRESELLALTWDVIDLKRGFLIVRKGKGAKQRLVTLIPQAAEALKEIPKRIKEPRVFWWVRSRYEVYKRFRRRLRWARLKGYRFHDLRHTHASYAAMAGVDLQVIAKNLGHSGTTVTRRYAHLSPAYQQQELQKIGSVWKPGAQSAHTLSKALKS